MSKRCELKKAYYKGFGNYKGKGKYTDDYVEWLEKIIVKSNENELKKLRVADVILPLHAGCIGGSSNNFAGICTSCGKRH